jgi:hypothetical protein
MFQLFSTYLTVATRGFHPEADPSGSHLYIQIFIIDNFYCFTLHF